MSKTETKQRPTEAQLKLLRRALREKLEIDTGLTKKKKKKEVELTDPDEEMAAKGKAERKGYADIASGRG